MAPPNCFKCQFFYMTYESKMPHGCNKFGFKCKSLPSLEVLSTSGEHCVFFRPTPQAAAAQPGPPDATDEPDEPLRDGSTFTTLG